MFSRKQVREIPIFRPLNLIGAHAWHGNNSYLTMISPVTLIISDEPFYSNQLVNFIFVNQTQFMKKDLPFSKDWLKDREILID